MDLHLCYNIKYINNIEEAAGSAVLLFLSLILNSCLAS